MVFNQTVTVTGAPRLRFSITGPGDEYAAYVSGSGSDTLVFSYTVLATDTDADGIYLYDNPLDYPDDAADSIVGANNNLPAVNEISGQERVLSWPQGRRHESPTRRSSGQGRTMVGEPGLDGGERLGAVLARRLRDEVADARLVEDCTWGRSRCPASPRAWCPNPSLRLMRRPASLRRERRSRSAGCSRSGSCIT